METIERNFIPGGEWLFLKIYSGPKILENILTDKIYPQIHSFIKNEWIDSFFFIRYTDPEYHIRLRFHSSNPKTLWKILIHLHPILSQLVQTYMISNVVIDTYSRELERYGENNILYVERVFFHDSIFVCEFLSECPNADQKRWTTCCLQIDSILNICDFSLADKINFCKEASKLYNQEFFGDTHWGEKQWGQKYRQYRNELNDILKLKIIDTRILELLGDFSHNTSEYFKTIREKSEKQFFTSVLSSIIHMHINRMYRTKQRLNECAIYNLLLRFYQSNVYLPA